MDKPEMPVQSYRQNQPTKNVAVPPVETVKKLQVGKVYNCDRLYVRRQPQKDGLVVTIIPKDTMVKIDKTLTDYYKVSLDNGEIGFCHKDFIDCIN